MRTAHREASKAKRQIMPVLAAQDDDWHDHDDSLPCDRCEGEGVIMVCPDDLCRNSGSCALGETDLSCFGTCYQCKGTGGVT